MSEPITHHSPTGSSGEEEVPVRTRTCGRCEVTWTSFDATCWLCGHDADDELAQQMTQQPARPAAVQATIAGRAVAAGGPSWRGYGHRQAHALGLPDPRSPQQHTA